MNRVVLLSLSPFLLTVSLCATPHLSLSLSGNFITSLSGSFTTNGSLGVLVQVDADGSNVPEGISLSCAGKDYDYALGNGYYWARRGYGQGGISEPLPSDGDLFPPEIPLGADGANLTHGCGWATWANGTLGGPGQGRASVPFAQGGSGDAEWFWNRVKTGSTGDTSSYYYPSPGGSVLPFPALRNLTGEVLAGKPPGMFTVRYGRWRSPNEGIGGEDPLVDDRFDQGSYSVNVTIPRNARAERQPCFADTRVLTDRTDDGGSKYSRISGTLRRLSPVAAAAVYGDFDGDGGLDLLAARGDAALGFAFMRGTGDLGTTPSTTGTPDLEPTVPVGHDIYVDDIPKYSHVPISDHSHGGTTGSVKSANDPDNRRTATNSFADVTVVSGDIDGDGADDVVVCGGGHGTRVYLSSRRPGRESRHFMHGNINEDVPEPPSNDEKTTKVSDFYSPFATPIRGASPGQDPYLDGRRLPVSFDDPKILDKRTYSTHVQDGSVIVLRSSSSCLLVDLDLDGSLDLVLSPHQRDDPNLADGWESQTDPRYPNATSRGESDLRSRLSGPISDTSQANSNIDNNNTTSLGPVPNATCAIVHWGVGPLTKGSPSIPSHHWRSHPSDPSASLGSQFEGWNLLSSGNSGAAEWPEGKRGQAPAFIGGARTWAEEWDYLGDWARRGSSVFPNGDNGGSGNRRNDSLLPGTIAGVFTAAPQAVLHAGCAAADPARRARSMAVVDIGGRPGIVAAVARDTTATLADPGGDRSAPVVVMIVEREDGNRTVAFPGSSTWPERGQGTGTTAGETFGSSSSAAAAAAAKEKRAPTPGSERVRSAAVGRSVRVWVPSGTSDVGPVPHICTGDVDGDGSVDAVLTSALGGGEWVLSFGARDEPLADTVRVSRGIGVGSTGSGDGPTARCLVTDINGDGLPDVVTRGFGDASGSTPVRVHAADPSAHTVDRLRSTKQVRVSLAPAVGREFSPRVVSPLHALSRKAKDAFTDAMGIALSHTAGIPSTGENTDARVSSTRPRPANDATLDRGGPTVPLAASRVPAFLSPGAQVYLSYSIANRTVPGSNDGTATDGTNDWNDWSALREKWGADPGGVWSASAVNGGSAISQQVTHRVHRLLPFVPGGERSLLVPRTARRVRLTVVWPGGGVTQQPVPERLIAFGGADPSRSPTASGAVVGSGAATAVANGYTRRGGSDDDDFDRDDGVDTRVYAGHADAVTAGSGDGSGSSSSATADGLTAGISAPLLLTVRECGPHAQSQSALASPTVLSHIAFDTLPSAPLPPWDCAVRERTRVIVSPHHASSTSRLADGLEPIGAAYGPARYTSVSGADPLDGATRRALTAEHSAWRWRHGRESRFEMTGTGFLSAPGGTPGVGEYLGWPGAFSRALRAGELAPAVMTPGFDPANAKVLFRDASGVGYGTVTSHASEYGHQSAPAGSVAHPGSGLTVSLWVRLPPSSNTATLPALHRLVEVARADSGASLSVSMSPTGLVHATVARSYPATDDDVASLAVTSRGDGWTIPRPSSTSADRWYDTNPGAAGASARHVSGFGDSYDTTTASQHRVDTDADGTGGLFDEPDTLGNGDVTRTARWSSLGWHHLVVTVQADLTLPVSTGGVRFEMFVDGVAAPTTAATPLPVSGGDFATLRPAPTAALFPAGLGAFETASVVVNPSNATHTGASMANLFSGVYQPRTTAEIDAAQFRDSINDDTAPSALLVDEVSVHAGAVPRGLATAMFHGVVHSATSDSSISHVTKFAPGPEPQGFKPNRDVFPYLPVVGSPEAPSATLVSQTVSQLTGTITAPGAKLPAGGVPRRSGVSVPSPIAEPSWHRVRYGGHLGTFDVLSTMQMISLSASRAAPLALGPGGKTQSITVDGVAVPDGWHTHIRIVTPKAGLDRTSVIASKSADGAEITWYTATVQRSSTTSTSSTASIRLLLLKAFPTAATTTGDLLVSVSYSSPYLVIGPGYEAYQLNVYTDSTYPAVEVDGTPVPPRVYDYPQRVSTLAPGTSATATAAVTPMTVRVIPGRVGYPERVISMRMLRVPRPPTFAFSGGSATSVTLAVATQFEKGTATAPFYVYSVAVYVTGPLTQAEVSSGILSNALSTTRSRSMSNRKFTASSAALDKYDNRVVDVIVNSLVGSDWYITCEVSYGNTLSSLSSTRVTVPCVASDNAARDYLIVNTVSSSNVELTRASVHFGYSPSVARGASAPLDKIGSGDPLYAGEVTFTPASGIINAPAGVSPPPGWRDSSLAGILLTPTSAQATVVVSYAVAPIASQATFTSLSFSRLQSDFASDTSAGRTHRFATGLSIPAGSVAVFVATVVAENLRTSMAYWFNVTREAGNDGSGGSVAGDSLGLKVLEVLAGDARRAAAATAANASDCMPLEAVPPTRTFSTEETSYTFIAPAGGMSVTLYTEPVNPLASVEILAPAPSGTPSFANGLRPYLDSSTELHRGFGSNVVPEPSGMPKIRSDVPAAKQGESRVPNHPAVFIGVKVTSPSGNSSRTYMVKLVYTCDMRLDHPRAAGAWSPLTFGSMSSPGWNVSLSTGGPPTVSSLDANPYLPYTDGLTFKNDFYVSTSQGYTQSVLRLPGLHIPRPLSYVIRGRVHILTEQLSSSASSQTSASLAVFPNATDAASVEGFMASVMAQTNGRLALSSLRSLTSVPLEIKSSTYPRSALDYSTHSLLFGSVASSTDSDQIWARSANVMLQRSGGGSDSTLSSVTARQRETSAHVRGEPRMSLSTVTTENTRQAYDAAAESPALVANERVEAKFTDVSLSLTGGSCVPGEVSTGTDDGAVPSADPSDPSLSRQWTCRSLGVPAGSMCEGVSPTSVCVASSSHLATLRAQASRFPPRSGQTAALDAFTRGGGCVASFPPASLCGVPSRSFVTDFCSGVSSSRAREYICMRRRLPHPLSLPVIPCVSDSDCPAAGRAMCLGTCGSQCAGSAGYPTAAKAAGGGGSGGDVPLWAGIRTGLDGDVCTALVDYGAVAPEGERVCPLYPWLEEPAPGLVTPGVSVRPVAIFAFRERSKPHSFSTSLSTDRWSSMAMTFTFTGVVTEGTGFAVGVTESDVTGTPSPTATVTPTPTTSALTSTPPKISSATRANEATPPSKRSRDAVANVPLPETWRSLDEALLTEPTGLLLESAGTSGVSKVTISISLTNPAIPELVSSSTSSASSTPTPTPGSSTAPTATGTRVNTICLSAVGVNPTRGSPPSTPVWSCLTSDVTVTTSGPVSTLTTDPIPSESLLGYAANQGIVHLAFTWGHGSSATSPMDPANTITPVPTSITVPGDGSGSGTGGSGVPVDSGSGESDGGGVDDPLGFGMGALPTYLVLAAAGVAGLAILGIGAFCLVRHRRKKAEWFDPGRDSVAATAGTAGAAGAAGGAGVIGFGRRSNAAAPPYQMPNNNNVNMNMNMNMNNGQMPGLRPNPNNVNQPQAQPQQNNGPMGPMGPMPPNPPAYNGLELPGLGGGDGAYLGTPADYSAYGVPAYLAQYNENNNNGATSRNGTASASESLNGDGTTHGDNRSELGPGGHYGFNNNNNNGNNNGYKNGNNSGYNNNDATETNGSRSRAGSAIDFDYSNVGPQGTSAARDDDSTIMDMITKGPRAIFRSFMGSETGSVGSRSTAASDDDDDDGRSAL